MRPIGFWDIGHEVTYQGYTYTIMVGQLGDIFQGAIWRNNGTIAAAAVDAPTREHAFKKAKAWARQDAHTRSVHALIYKDE